MARSRKTALVVRLAPALLMLFAAPANGALIRYDFGGVLTQADASTGVAPGTRFAGSFTYDGAALPVQSGEFPNSRGDFSNYLFGTHRLQDGSVDGSGIELRIDGGPTARSEGGLSVDSYSTMRPANQESPAIQLLIQGDFPGDAKGQGPDYGLGIFFAGQRRVISPDEPIPTDLALSDFSEAKVYLMGRLVQHPPEWYEQPMNVDSPPQLAEGTIDTLTATPVPEPAWTVAALLGAAVWAARRRASR